MTGTAAELLAARAARAALGNIDPKLGAGGGSGNPPGRPPGGPMPGLNPAALNILALAFSAAAAAAMRLLFSASDRRGDRKRNEGSIPGGMPYESLQKINKMLIFVEYFYDDY